MTRMTPHRSNNPSESPAGTDPLARFTELYRQGPAWEIGRPQEAFIKLFEAGRLKGSILDVGCGSGQLSVFLALQGMNVMAIDLVPQVVESARKLAESNRVHVEWAAMDALRLSELNRSFDTILDSGVYHVFPPATRKRYVQSLASVSHAGTQLFLVCFSDLEPGDEGPLRIRREQIQDDFAEEWTIDRISPTRYQVNEAAIRAGRFDAEGARAWLAEIRRKPGG